MITDNDQIFELAVNALKDMLEKHGPDHKFPPDAIWQHVPPDVQIPSTKKPHQPGRLVKEGYLQDTGAKTRAQSGPRAGSTTNEYRFGPKLVPEHAPAPSTPAQFATASGAKSPSEALRGIQEAMEAEGYMISAAELANFFLAMTVSPMVILSGISGTGKSLLPRKFAKLTRSFFYAIPVQPQWSDNSDLFGYVPSLSSDKFIKGKLIDALVEAKRNPGKLVIALLDEMNLAPVEHYFSDFLSVAESRERKGPTLGSDPLPIELPSLSTSGPDEHAELRGIQLPHNLRVIGTANMDETTHTFSPKVLDRAFTIEFDDPDLTAFASETASTGPAFESLAEITIDPNNAISIMEAHSKNRDLFEHVAAWLDEIQSILSPAGIKFGYRTRDSILLYLHFWREMQLSDILAGYAALDFCLLQKVLPKISGSGDTLGKALKGLREWLMARSEPKAEEDGIDLEFVGSLERSLGKVGRMIDLLELDGSTRYWGT